MWRHVAATRDAAALRGVLEDWSQQNADLRLALDGVDERGGEVVLDEAAQERLRSRGHLQ